MIRFYCLIFLWTSSLFAADPNCVEFFHLKRPLISSVLTHEFVASREGGLLRLYGLTKGEDDYEFARSKLLEESREDGLIPFHRSCGMDGRRALETAKRVSRYWNRRYQGWLSYLTRMALTPLLGRPCARAAEDIVNKVRMMETSRLP